VLRGERADVTDFFLFSWPWWMGSVVKHNMLKTKAGLDAVKKRRTCYHWLESNPGFPVVQLLVSSCWLTCRGFNILT